MKSRLKSLLLLLEVRSEVFLTSVALTISSSKFFTWAKNNSFTFEEFNKKAETFKNNGEF